MLLPFPQGSQDFISLEQRVKVMCDCSQIWIQYGTGACLFLGGGVVSSVSQTLVIYVLPQDFSPIPDYLYFYSNVFFKLTFKKLNVS